MNGKQTSVTSEIVRWGYKLGDSIHMPSHTTPHHKHTKKKKGREIDRIMSTRGKKTPRQISCNEFEILSEQIVVLMTYKLLVLWYVEGY